MSDHNYFYLGGSADPRHAEIDALADVLPNLSDLSKGRSIAAGPPTGPVPLSGDGGDMLTELLGNSSRALIVSEATKSVLLDQGLNSDEIEFVALDVVDKRGHPASKNYFIANPLEKIACLDVEHSNAVATPAGKVVALYSIAIRSGSIPDDKRLFRIAEFPRLALVRGDLLSALEAAGLTGYRTVAMGEDIY